MQQALLWPRKCQTLVEEPLVVRSQQYSVNDSFWGWISPVNGKTEDGDFFFLNGSWLQYKDAIPMKDTGGIRGQQEGPTGTPRKKNVHP